MDNPPALLPHHGWIECRKCFPPGSDETQIGTWKVVNNLGAWGSSHPRVLVLGFSNGHTQSKAGHEGRFESVAFKGMRRRPGEILSTVGK
ncbi:hypothetical protein DK847_16645 [Aestuariivirga litoralis]|uniref:Uncharacterized protein n=1 Tax=Aestuariivirga litoralis TaxID=2650924 RepID=A0A2W2BI51_9HYPH|nr:hypothetical protein DK847_16645 [Aestuariivirga litoralis]